MRVWLWALLGMLVAGCAPTQQMVLIDSLFLQDEAVEVGGPAVHPGTEASIAASEVMRQGVRYKNFLFKSATIQEGIMDELVVTLGADGSMAWKTRVRGRMIDLGSARTFTMRFSFQRANKQEVWRSPNPPPGWRGWWTKKLPKSAAWVRWDHGAAPGFPKELFPAIERMVVYRSCG